MVVIEGATDRAPPGGPNSELHPASTYYSNQATPSVLDNSLPTAQFNTLLHNQLGHHTMPAPPASPSLPPLSPTIAAPSPSVQQLREAFSASSPALAPSNSIRHTSASPRLGTPKGSNNGNVGLGFGTSDELGMSPSLGGSGAAKGVGNVTSPQELTAFVSSSVGDIQVMCE